MTVLWTARTTAAASITHTGHRDDGGKVEGSRQSSAFHRLLQQ